MYIDLAPGTELQLTDAISMNNRYNNSKASHWNAVARGGKKFEDNFVLKT